MKTLTSYESIDGKLFTDPALCARHEFMHVDGLLEQFNELMQNMNLSEFLNWNDEHNKYSRHSKINEKFTKYHWQVWRQSLPTQEYEDAVKYSHDDYIHFEAIPKDTTKVLSLLKKLQPYLTHQEANEILDSTDKVIGNYSHLPAVDITKQFRKLGATVGYYEYKLKPLLRTSLENTVKMKV